MPKIISEGKMWWDSIPKGKVVERLGDRIAEGLKVVSLEPAKDGKTWVARYEKVFPK